MYLFAPFLALSCPVKRCADADRSVAQRLGFSGATQTAPVATGRSVGDATNRVKEQKIHRARKRRPTKPDRRAVLRQNRGRKAAHHLAQGKVNRKKNVRKKYPGFQGLKNFGDKTGSGHFQGKVPYICIRKSTITRRKRSLSTILGSFPVLSVITSLN